MLTECEMHRVATLWSPERWPDFTDAVFASAGHRSPFSYYVERVRHLGLSGGRLIEAGCGAGRWCFAFATCFDEVIGFDYTPARAATAIWLNERFNLSNVTFMRGDVRQTPAADESVDVAYSNSLALGWVSLEVILAECYRVLRPGGVCYIGLNGAGYAYYLASKDDPVLADLGVRRIYNDLCQSRLMSLAPAIAPGGALHRRARSALQARPTAVDFLSRVEASPSQVEAARIIAADLDGQYSDTLVEDLAGFCAGRQAGFSHTNAGRGYEPDELAATARRVGFSRFEWALDGCLSLQTDGSVRKGPSATARPTLGEFDGRIRVYEALMWKPQGGRRSEPGP